MKPKYVPYSELLKNPLWQRKRLEILQRDNFTCVKCGATDKTLHVHHGFYWKGFEIWNYPNGSLQTLCDDCHSQEHEEGPTYIGEAIESLKSCGFLSGDIHKLAHLVSMLRLIEKLSKEEVFELLKNRLSNSPEE